MERDRHEDYEDSSALQACIKFALLLPFRRVVTSWKGGRAVTYSVPGGFIDALEKP